MTSPLTNDRLRLGFEKIDRDRDRLLHAFADVLRDLGHSEIADALPWIGKRFDDPDSPVNPVDLCQATTIAFHLLNIVEENAANQMRRHGERTDGLLAESGLWGWYFRRLSEAGIDPVELRDCLRKTSVEPVLTAHPTESKRITVLEQHRELYLLLVDLENTMYTPTEQAVIEERIRAVLERLWRTGETLLEKPTVASERNAMLHYLRSVFPHAVRDVDAHLRSAWQAAGFDPVLLDDPEELPSLRFGTWVGGDRDGHPLVTPEVTRETFSQLRIHALRLQRQNLERLRAELSLSSLLVAPPADFQSRLESRLKGIGPVGQAIADRNPAEPWRQYVSAMLEALPPEDDTDPRPMPFPHYRTAEELVGDLRTLRDSLFAIGADRLARASVDPAIRAAKTFGFHLARLDVRQNSGFHDRAIDQILTTAGFSDPHFSSWDEARRLEFLNQTLTDATPLLPLNAYTDNEAGLAVGAFREIARQLELRGDEGIGILILSMTRTVSDLLAVYFLAREAGLLFRTDTGIICRVPISPLLETIDDLRNGPSILDAFIRHPITSATLEWRRQRHAGDPFDTPRMEVMVGYSDSNKDGGIIASQWTLHQAQQAIAATARRHGITARFFHGRGGTISRGAGPTHRFLEALPPSSIGGGLRVTEQGETIAQKYGNLLTASHNLDLLLSGTAYRAFCDKNPVEVDPDRTRLLDQVAEESRRTYRALLETGEFMQFYRQATPIDLLESSRIGSRPSRRTGAASLDDLRAIPWVFSWSQSRFFLPGWYGVGTALEAVLEKGGSDASILRDAVSEWPFLRYVLTNVEMSSLSTDPEIFCAYAALVESGDIRDRFLRPILNELEKTRRVLNDVFGSEAADRRPRLFKTLTPRADAIRPLHHLQIRLLRDWRTALREGDSERTEALHPHLLLSVNAISSGLRTTG